MKAIKLYLGLDVHKDSITLAIAPAGRSSETGRRQGHGPAGSIGAAVVPLIG